MTDGCWLSIIGIGDDGLAGLSEVARSTLGGAEVIFGGQRHLAALGDDGREQIEWSSPFAGTTEKLLTYRGRSVAILASGDPMWFGAGSTLVQTIPASEMRIIPAPSAYSLAAAYLGWPLDGVDCLTVHGRPLEAVLPFVVPEAKLLIYCNDGETPSKLASLLCARGFENSRLTALSHLGGPTESEQRATAENWDNPAVPALTTLAIDCIASAGARFYSAAPGLPDDAYEHDGKLTKRDARAATLAALMPVRGQYLWDVGAGCGSIGIEWCRAANAARATAIESDPGRIDMIRTNALALGVPVLDIRQGAAPTAFEGLPPPDAIFIGGGLAADGVIETCWSALKDGGRLVANAVTLQGEEKLIALHRRLGGELVRIAISRVDPIGKFEGWHPMRPVTQFRIQKS